MKHALNRRDPAGPPSENSSLRPPAPKPTWRHRALLEALQASRRDEGALSEADREALLRVDRMLAALESMKGPETADSTFAELLALLESDAADPPTDRH